MQNLTPRHIEAAESKILGIEQGWYGVKVSGTIMTGPASTHEKCLETIGLLPDPVIKGPALTHDAVPTHNDDESLCRPVLQRLRSCRRFLFIKLARNEAEPSAKVKHAEIPRSRRQCIARQRCLHCHCLPVRLCVVGCSFLIRPGGRRAAQSRRARLVVGRLPDIRWFGSQFFKELYGSSPERVS